ncbi:hypothetical protein Droror1_Dr00028261, partial [Drosera rotundifolia]
MGLPLPLLLSVASRLGKELGSIAPGPPNRPSSSRGVGGGRRGGALLGAGGGGRDVGGRGGCLSCSSLSLSFLLRGAGPAAPLRLPLFFSFPSGPLLTEPFVEGGPVETSSRQGSQPALRPPLEESVCDGLARPVVVCGLCRFYALAVSAGLLVFLLELGGELWLVLFCGLVVGLAATGGLSDNKGSPLRGCRHLGFMRGFLVTVCYYEWLSYFCFASYGRRGAVLIGYQLVLFFLYGPRAVTS